MKMMMRMIIIINGAKNCEDHTHSALDMSQVLGAKLRTINRRPRFTNTFHVHKFNVGRQRTRILFEKSRA